MLCSSCAKIDPSLLLSIADNRSQSRGIGDDYFRHDRADVWCFRHSTAFSALELTVSKGCGLCTIIRATIGNTPIDTDEEASALPIILHGGKGAQIVVSLNSPKGGLVKLGALDVSRDFSKALHCAES